ncbi:hypothetical protein B0H13DRAFT_2530851 [Mycena leptocephala]|nr:hypothetical protein B0H13DRAFT_2530851 [Mycena leptocephala]
MIDAHRFLSTFPPSLFLREDHMSYICDSTDVHPAFPAELERTIFEVAAHVRPLLIPTFMLVAWRVKIWVEPLLLSWSARDSQALKDHPIFTGDTLLPIIQSQSFGSFVRNLLLPWPSIGDAKTILSACRSVENLWISTAASFAPSQLTSLTNSFQRSHIWGYSIGHELWRGLAHIPHLTNLSFEDERVVGGVWLNLLRTCKSLRVLVVLYQRLDAIIAGHPDEQELAKDSRFVAMGCQSRTKDWRMGAVDYWSRAEDFVAKQDK